MKTTLPSALVIIVAAGSLLLVSCASTGVKRSASAASILDSKTARLNQFNDLLTTLNGSLSALEQAASTDPRKPYNAFTSTTKKLNHESVAIDKEATSLQQQTRKRFDLWQAEIATIQDEDLRHKAERRREEEMAKSKEIETSMQKMVQSYQPLKGKLQDLQTFLDNDLNASGINSATRLISVVRKDSESLQNEIQQMVQAIDKVSAETSPRPAAKVPDSTEAKAATTEAK